MVRRGRLEKDTCEDLVLPALAEAGWSPEMIRAEFPVRSDLVADAAGSERDLGDGRVDYVLEPFPGVPVAVVEAKREYRSPADGLQQALRYAQQLCLSRAYSTNGHGYVERDLATGRERPLGAIPSPIELWSAHVKAAGLGDADASLLEQPFNRNLRTAAGAVIEPRWYQGAAVQQVLAAIARGQQRVLLLMATGTGKTFTAMQVVHKLREWQRAVDPTRNYRVLYLADLDVLLTQPMGKDFAQAFGTEPLRRVKGTADLNRELYFASYQALSGGGDEEELFRSYRPDFFDLVIVDECHRGSAAADSSWRRILDHFASAVQLGLTATPKQQDDVDTLDYFGDPVFTYTLRQGIEDGYLAPYRVRRVVLSPDADGWEPSPGQVDRLGRDIPEGIYSTRDFERVVSLLARTDLVARHLTAIFAGDPLARAMVFCVDQQHAEDMRSALVRHNAELCREDPEWVVRIVGSEPERVRLLEDFCDPERDTPAVATTSKLLSTGVDVPDLKYVVLFRGVGSMVEFKQIIGRGTRLFPDKGKVSFEIVDYVGATAHFADPDFDGYPVTSLVQHVDGEGLVVEEIESGEAGREPVENVEPGVSPGLDQGDDHAGRDRRHRFMVDDGDFEVVVESLQVVDTATGRLVLTEYGEYVSRQVRALVEDANELGQVWSTDTGRERIRAELGFHGIQWEVLIADHAADVDPLDTLVQVAWNVVPPTRAERVRRVRERHHDELEARSAVARQVLDALLDRYVEHGVDDIASAEVLALPPLSALGTPLQIARELGGVERYRGQVAELQRWLYANSA